MLDRERDTYATSLAIYAGNKIASEQASQESLDFSRQVIALALHLSPRNRRAVVLNFQLEKGLMPETLEPKYSDKSLAHLFMMRAEQLFGQQGEANQLLSRYLISLAATIDPHNEDAVYAFQMQEIDKGAVSWALLLEDGKTE